MNIATETETNKKYYPDKNTVWKQIFTEEINRIIQEINHDTNMPEL